MATQKSSSKIEVGWKAPDFTLFDNQMKRKNLKEFLNDNLILAFFPGAFTSTCTREACTFRDSLAKLGSLNAKVVGISVNDPWSSRAFAEKNMLNFPLLCDYNSARPAANNFIVTLQTTTGSININAVYSSGPTSVA